jgi:hypothetical protein
MKAEQFSYQLSIETKPDRFLRKPSGFHQFCNPCFGSECFLDSQAANPVTLQSGKRRVGEQYSSFVLIF